MEELDREQNQHHPVTIRSCAIVGAGRLGGSMATALSQAGVEVQGPLGRGEIVGSDVDVVLLCVPDGEIEAAARMVPGGRQAHPDRTTVTNNTQPVGSSGTSGSTVSLPIIGHCSGMTGLSVFNGRESFGIHPLMTFPTSTSLRFAGAPCAVGGTSTRALRTAERLAQILDMRAFLLADEDRAAYHTGASFASNFLVTIARAAENLLETAGVDRKMLLPLMRATIDNWEELGSERALTGPIARNDRETIDRQREAVSVKAPELLELYDALVNATQRLAVTPLADPGSTN